MFFTSGYYFTFLISIFFAYWLIADRYQWRVAFLIIASYFFYAHAGPIPLLLLLVISTIDFTTTRLMIKYENRRRKLLLCTSLFVDIGSLLLFKYSNFFIEAVTSGLLTVGLTVPNVHFSILAPIGISFFIFQSVSYVIDVYRKDAEPALN